MHTSDTTHLEMVHPILCYVKCIINIGLHFFFYITLDLLAFSNVDWEGCHTTRHSTIRFCVFLENNLISYCIKKQHTISRSNTKAEYRFMANTISEVALMTFILKDLHIPVQSLPILYCDYLNALHITVNPVFHARNKYIESDYHSFLDNLSPSMFSLIIKLLTFSLNQCKKMLLFKPNSTSIPDIVCRKLLTQHTPIMAAIV